jgi:hypothetical protein
METIRHGVLAAAFALVAGIGTARAQDDFDIALVSGGKPVADVEVLLLASGGKVDLGTSGGNGVVTVPADATSVPVGTPVDVYLIECDDTVVVVLVTPDEREALEEECERRRRENPDCTCRRIGAFLWGNDVTIDVASGTVISRTMEGESPIGDDGFRPIQIGFGLGYSRWPHLDRACNLDGVVGCELQDDRPMYDAVLEWYARPRIGLGMEFNYTPGLEVDHTSFETGAGFPDHNVTDLDVLGVGFLGIVRVPLGLGGRHAVFAVFGPMWTVNLGDVRSDYGSLGLVEESRHDPGLRLGARAGFDWTFGGGPWGSRFEIGGMTGEDPDIDTSWFLGWKLLYRLSGTGGGL